MANNTDYSTYILPAGLITIAFIGGKKILEFLHVIDDKDAQQKAAENKSVASQDYWNPQYYKDLVAQGKTVSIITVAQTATLVTALKNAHGTFNDNEDAIYGAFRAIHTYTQLSYLCDKFLAATGKDLLGFLYGGGGGYNTSGFLNDSEFNVIVSIISKYTSGIK